MSPGNTVYTAIQIVPYDHLANTHQARVHPFLAAHPHNTIFQSPTMFAFYNKVNKFNPHYFIALHNNEVIGVLLAVIIREYNGLLGFISSRTVVYGGPVVCTSTHRQNALNSLLTKLVATCSRQSMFIQFRNFFAWNEVEKALFDRHGFTFRDRINLIIPTQTPHQVLSGMKENRRRQINQGMKQGCQLRPPKNIEEMKQLYRLLRDLYKNKVRKPLPDWSFFLQFYHYCQHNNLGIIRVLVNNNRVIGGIISPITENRTIYEWYVVGLDQKYPKHHPSILATWSALEYATAHHLQHFDLMGLGKPDEPYGVREFKLRFGGEIVNYGRFGRRNHPRLYALAEMAYNLLRQCKKV